MAINSEDLVAQALTRASRSEPALRLAATMRAARVQWVANKGGARITLEMALEELKTIKGQEHDSLLHEARSVTCVVAADLLQRIPPSRMPLGDFESGFVIHTMLAHGMVDAAYDYAVACAGSSAFPITFVANLLHDLAEDDPRCAILLRTAFQAWKDAEIAGLHRMHANHFLMIFAGRWQALPVEEARAIVREMAAEALARSEWPTSAQIDESLRFTSEGQNMLFQVWDVLQELDPSLAAAVVAQRSELAAAVERYPLGWKSLVEQSQKRAEKMREECKAMGEELECGYMFAGDPRDMEYARALHEARTQGNFADAMGCAAEKYREDADPKNPNTALKAVWPSTTVYRSILYQAGCQKGADAARYLDEIPDEEVRMLAAIELAAALAGLPELPGIQTRMHGRRNASVAAGAVCRIGPPLPLVGDRVAMTGPGGELISCPKCEWAPAAEDRWGCRCGQTWNTFTSRGQCPRCQYQWKVTQCMRCGELSPHAAWYKQM